MSHQPYPGQFDATNWFHVLSTCRWAPGAWINHHGFRFPKDVSGIDQRLAAQADHLIQLWRQQRGDQP